MSCHIRSFSNKRCNFQKTTLNWRVKTEKPPTFYIYSKKLIFTPYFVITANLSAESKGWTIHILDSANNPTIDDLAICLHCFRKQQNTITHGERSKSLSDFLPWYIITKLKHLFKPWIKKKLKISKPWKKNNHSKHQIIIIGKILHCMVNISMLG